MCRLVACDFETALSKSAEDFDRLIRPIAARVLRGRFGIVEADATSELAHSLDVEAGIDMWFVRDGTGIRGVANRVQWSDRYWRTFTVRMSRESGASTEYEKRVHAMQHEWLYPVLTMQSYITEDRQRLLGFGVMRTRDLMKFVRDGVGYERQTGAAQIGQATFWVVPWDTVAEVGVQFYEYVPE